MMLATTPIVHHPFNFGIAGFNFTGFGIAVLLSFLIAQVVSERELARRHRDVEAAAVSDVLFAALLGTMIGAKVYYVIVVSHQISDLWSRGGFVFWGGFVGSVVLCWMTIRYKRLQFWRFADVGGIAIAAGYAVGRTGCWAVGDDYGKLYNGPLAVVFPEGAPPSTAISLQQNFHVQIPPGVAPNTLLSVFPSQLLEVVLGFAMFAILWRIRDHKHAEGWLFGVWCVLAGVERFIAEFFRAKDDRFSWGFGLSMAQIIAIGIVIVGAAIMKWRSGTSAESPGIHGAAIAAA